LGYSTKLGMGITDIVVYTGFSESDVL